MLPVEKTYDVVIVNYNGEKIISPCLKSLFASTTQPSKVIIYDNHSSDASTEIIKKKFPQVILIEGDTNLGFGRANNEAMKRSDADFILFMNNDLILGKNCAEALLRGIIDDAVAVVNPLIYKDWVKRKDQEIYSFGAEMNRSGFGYSLTEPGIDRIDLSCFSGACFMAQAETIKKLRFEDHFFLYYEEPDLSARLLMAGHKIGRQSEAVCYHLESYSSPQKTTDGICFRQFNGIQNRWYMLGHYWPTGKLLQALPLNIAHLIYNVFFFLKNQKFREAKILGLAPARLFEGRKRYVPRPDNGWINQLAPVRLSNLSDNQKKVYR